MNHKRFVSLIPYSVFPTNTGGKRCVVFFQEELSQQASLMAIGTKNNILPKNLKFNFQLLLSSSFLRYCNPFLYFKIKHIIQEQNANYFSIEHPYYAWLGYLIKKTTKAKWIIRSHNIEYERFRTLGKPWWPILKIYEQWAYKQADYNLCITTEDKNTINSITKNTTKQIDFPYGIENLSIPNDREECNLKIRTTHDISAECKILLFNGALDYLPNLEALHIILEYINPVLLSSNFKYKILICGNKLPAYYENLKNFEANNIIYCGFVEDINAYFKSADVFLNPIISGGGIKTKLVEALAWNCNVVSTDIGSVGIMTELCKNKLHIVYNNNWNEFAARIISIASNKDNISEKFFEYYAWTNIVKRLLNLLD